MGKMTQQMLTLPKAGANLIVEPDQTTKSCTSGLRQRYVLIPSAAYALIHLAAWVTIRRTKKGASNVSGKRDQRAFLAALAMSLLLAGCKEM